MRSKSAIVIVLLTLLLLVSNAIWVYGVIDRGVSITHRAIQVEHERDSARLLADVVLASELPLDRSRLEQAIDALPDRSHHVVQQEGAALYIDDVSFVLEGDRVIGIHFMWEPGAPSAGAR